MAHKHVPLACRCQVPEPYDAIDTGRGQRGTIRGEGQAIDLLVISIAKCRTLLPGNDVDELDDPVDEAYGKRLAVGCEDQAEDRLVDAHRQALALASDVPDQRQKLLGRLRVALQR